MATLTEISVYTRKLIVWIIVFIIAFTILRLLIIFAVNYYKATHPAKEPPPNVLFGKLTQPIFPKETADTSGYTFVLQNIEGKPPETTASGKVYFIPKKLSSLLAPQKAKSEAAKIDFTADPQVMSATLYRFTDQVDPNRIMDLDIVYLNFQLDYNFKSQSSLFDTLLPTSGDQMLSDLNSYLQTNGLVDTSIINSRANFTYMNYNPATSIFTPVNKKENANVLRVDYFRPDVDGMRLLPPKYNFSYNYTLVSSSNVDKKKYLKISYFFWPIAFDNFATYPLRTSKQAWDDLMRGNGKIARLGGNTKNKDITIRNIYLAYYDSGLQESYLQPIFVFEGDNNFVGYVPAVSSDWLE